MSKRKLLRRLYSLDAGDRWRAVRDIGDYAEAEWANSEKSVRDLMLRLAWSLNEESGATGWGAPEAMGEIIARARDLTAEYAERFRAYLVNEEVFLDNEILDAGTIWSIGRLGPGGAWVTDDLAGILLPFLQKSGPLVRAATAWTAGRVGLTELGPALEKTVEDGSPAVLLVDGEVITRSVGEFAREALPLIRGTR